MNRRAKVELFEQIRREYDYGAGTIKGVARKLGVHRLLVREALASAVPKDRKITIRPRTKLEPAIPFIDTILQADLTAPRKQRCLGWRGTGGLVRSLRRHLRRTREGLCVLHAQHDQWQSFPLRFPPCQPASVSGGAREGV